MTISEAAEKAYFLGWCFRRRSWDENVGIFPTNDKNCCCMLITAERSTPVRRWQPSYEDLVARDWEETCKLRPLSADFSRAGLI